MCERLRENEHLSSYRPDLIFVLSSGLHSSEASMTKLKPSWAARMRLIAAVELLKVTDKAPQIIVTGGNVYKGQPMLSLVGKQKLVDSYHIPDSQVIAVEGLNTVEEFGIIAKITRERGISPAHVAVISNEFHLIAQKLAQELGIRFFPAEELLIRRHKLYQRIIQDMSQSDHYQRLIKSQESRSKVLSLPLGKLIYRITDRWSKRNVVLTPFDPYGLQKL